jgi:hypothetical protein
MLKLRDLICEIIAERMSYEDLMANSDTERKDRASRIPARSLVVRSVNDREAWKFSYKTPKSEITTSKQFPNGQRHQGFIYFYKDDIKVGENAMKIDCSVDCSCKDYRYRMSYANKSQEAGENGPSSLNKGFNYPSSINRGPGLCKHLISLKEYLKTEVETTAAPVTPPPVKPTAKTKTAAAKPSKAGTPSKATGKATGKSVPVTTPVTTTPAATSKAAGKASKKAGEKPVLVPKSPAVQLPADDEEPDVIDKTKAPEPETGEEQPLVNPEVKPGVDKTQAPQEPDEVPVEEPNQQKKLKEETVGDKEKIIRALDNICKTGRIFII